MSELAPHSGNIPMGKESGGSGRKLFISKRDWCLHKILRLDSYFAWSANINGNPSDINFMLLILANEDSQCSFKCRTAWILTHCSGCEAQSPERAGWAQGGPDASIEAHENITVPRSPDPGAGPHFLVRLVLGHRVPRAQLTTDARMQYTDTEIRQICTSKLVLSHSGPGIRITSNQQ